MSKLIDEITATEDADNPVGASRRARIKHIVTIIAANNYGEYCTGWARDLLTEDDMDAKLGAVITGLVRSGHLTWTGRFDIARHPAQRHGLTPCKIYQLNMPITDRDYPRFYDGSVEREQKEAA